MKLSAWSVPVIVVPDLESLRSLHKTELYVPVPAFAVFTRGKSVIDKVLKNSRQTHLIGIKKQEAARVGRSF
jgi:hypothetical protein